MRRSLAVGPATPALLGLLAGLGIADSGCSRGRAPDSASAASTATASSTTGPIPSSTAASTPTPTDRAEIGASAPAFELPDVDGHVVRLSDFRGKVVVLEWFNPGCPFVNAAHTKGSLKGLAARHAAEGVVWLGIDSAAKGKQGYEPVDIRSAVTRFALSHPILRDESGAVGHQYGATNTPHMFVIDKAGTLVYAGAIDNSPDAVGESPEGPTLINYVDAALADLAAGRPVHTQRTKAYGCGVKYGS